MTTSEIEKRLEALEHRYLRLKILWVVSVVLLAGAYPAIEAVSNTAMLHGVVRAKQFIVEGPHGKPYARLNSYGLHLYNEQGKDVVDLVATGKPEPSIICELERYRGQSKDGKNVARKPCPKHRPTIAHLALNTGNGNAMVQLGRWPNSAFRTALEILSPSANRAASSVLTSKSITLTAPDGRAQIQAGSMSVSSPFPWPAIQLDASQEDGGPHILIRSQKGIPRLVVGKTQLVNMRTNATTDRSLSSIVLFDKKGKELWETPGD